MSLKLKSIFYVNYSPYENAGYILDYLLSNFRNVYLFSIGFHDLGEKRSKNRLILYKSGKKVMEKEYLHLRIPANFEYLFVPFRSLINLFQIYFAMRYLYKKYGKIDKYLSVNAFTTWVGLILKGFGYIQKTIFWVWDYYPLVHKNLLILLMRWIYWQFDRISMFSDKVVFLNNKLAIIHKRKNISKNNLKYSVVPIGTKISKRNIKFNKNNFSIVFLGVLKKSQGLDFIFDNMPALNNKYKNLNLKIVGGGPDKVYFAEKANKMKLRVKFFGNIDELTVDKIIRSSDIGIATYRPDKSNVSYFGDPSKVKRYLGFGLPVITTDVFDFSKNIKYKNAGFIVKYGDSRELIRSIRRIVLKYDYFSKNAHILAKTCEYNMIYREMFKI